MRPSRRADSSPALVRSRSMARSNSAKAPTICIIMRPAGGGGVDGLGQAAKSGFNLRQPLHKNEHIAERTREPVELPDHEDITLAEMIQQPVKFGPVPASAGGLFTIDARATGGLERRRLGRGVLLDGGDTGVANQHCINVSPIPLITQYLYATHKPQ